MVVIQDIRWPFYSEIVNKRSKSFNRATTLSLHNFLKSILDIPLLLTSAYIISFGYLAPMVLMFWVSCLVIITTWLPQDF